jgi:hypothetical protein
VFADSSGSDTEDMFADSSCSDTEHVLALSSLFRSRNSAMRPTS